MVEDFLHFIWSYQLFDRNALRSIGDEEIQVLSPGVYNEDSGPDFLNAKLLIARQQWVGNVEIHVHSSEWWRHGHHMDPSFNNVILHVVYKHDDTRKVSFETLELAGRVDLYRYRTFQSLRQTGRQIACRSSFSKVPSIIIKQMVDSCAIQRLESKVQAFELRLEENRGHWEYSLMQSLLLGLGSKVNKEACEFLSRILPFRVVLKNLENELVLSALVYGQAGFLNQDYRGAYPAQLQIEYDFLQLKYQLKPMPFSVWKFMRMRPRNFPSIRLAQFIAILRNWEAIKECVFYSFNWKELQKLLRVEINDYWLDHYHFTKKSKACKKNMGSQMVMSLLINSVIPLLYSFAKRRADEGLLANVIDLYEALSPENNNIIALYKQLGYQAQNALESQGLLELKNKFCSPKKCLSCKIGVYLVNSR